MLKKIVIGLIVIVAGFLVVVSRQPSEFKLNRSQKMNAAPKIVFEQVNDFHKWQVWSPWAKKDPQAKGTFEGAPAGEGAQFSWDGNKEVGAGRMTITESRPNELIRMNLEFFKPFKAAHNAEFTFTPEGEGTVMSWTMSGKQNFVGKAMCMFMNMDKMVGGDFEKGLAEIKTISESQAAGEAAVQAAQAQSKPKEKKSKK